MFISYLQKLLYQSGKVTSQVRLIQGQTVFQDDRKLSEYSLPEGATISALFEPEMDINIEVSTGQQKQCFTVSNTISVMALKSQIDGIMRCGVARAKLEIRLGDVTLEDAMPLHFYGILDGSKLNIVKPYVNVKIQNNKGAAIYWRIDRKDVIKEVKVKLVASRPAVPIRFHLYYRNPYDNNPTRDFRTNQSGFNEIRGLQEGCVSVEGMRLYVIRGDGEKFEELVDDETVENYKIEDGDKLFLLTYRWLHDEVDVTVLKTKSKIYGVEPDDTCMTIKVRVQDQTGLPAGTLLLAQAIVNNYDIGYYISRSTISDNNKHFNG